MTHSTKFPPALGLAAAVLLTLGSGSVLAQPPAADPPQVYHKTVKVGGVDLFYRDAGPKDAPVRPSVVAYSRRCACRIR